MVEVSAFSSGDSTETVTALESGRSPHGGGQRHVTDVSSTTRRVESRPQKSLLVTRRLSRNPGVLCIVAAPELYAMCLGILAFLILIGCGVASGHYLHIFCNRVSSLACFMTMLCFTLAYSCNFNWFWCSLSTSI